MTCDPALRVSVVACVFALSGASAAQAGVAAAPLSMAVIEASVTGATCSITALDGSMTTTPCDPAGWVAVLSPGWSAQMTATINYSYEDDGLPLGDSHPFFQTDHYGIGGVEPRFEAGAIYTLTNSSHCYTRYSTLCGNLPGDEYFGESGYPPIFLSNNDVADDVSGELSATTGVRWNPPSAFYGQGYYWTPTLYVSTWTMVASIPEPSTWALMLVPLLGLGLLGVRRHRSRTG